MGELFDRQVQLQMATVVVTGLRVQFKIEKNDQATPSHASITVWNLARKTRDTLSRMDVPVILMAGYGKDIEQIFYGDIAPLGISVVRNGPDWLTTFKAGDGLKCYQTDRIQMAFPANMSVKDAIGQILQQVRSADVSKTIASLKKQAVVGNFQQLLNSSVASGRAMDEANRLANSIGMKAIIIDGEVKLVKQYETSANGEESAEIIPYLTPQTGLIGSPEAMGAKKFIKFKCLLRPWIRPTKRVKVAWSIHPDGMLIHAARVTHTGDTRGQEWYTEVEGVAL